MRPVKKAALLHSLCGVGKASMTNMIPVLATLGVEACPIPTMLLSTHTGGYGKPEMLRVTPEYVRGCADHYVKNQISFDLIFIGYIGNVKLLDAVDYFLSAFPKAQVVFDPIMGDHGRYYSNFDDGYKESLLPLLQRADLILPNMTEACLLAGCPYKEIFTKEEVRDMIERLLEKGVDRVVLTSVRLAEEGFSLAIKEETLRFLPEQELPFSFHGSGDLFDGALVGRLLNGDSLSEAVWKAHRFVTFCMEESEKNQVEEREGILLERCLSSLV